MKAIQASMTVALLFLTAVVSAPVEADSSEKGLFPTDWCGVHDIALGNNYQFATYHFQGPYKYGAGEQFSIQKAIAALCGIVAEELVCKLTGYCPNGTATLFFEDVSEPERLQFTTVLVDCDSGHILGTEALSASDVIDQYYAGDYMIRPDHVPGQSLRTCDRDDTPMDMPLGDVSGDNAMRFREIGQDYSLDDLCHDLRLSVEAVTATARDPTSYALVYGSLCG